MSRKRICEDCGNKCNDEYCPICGRKTKVYNEASRQEDTLYDAAKYRTTADTKKAESGVFEEKKERIDDSERVREHRYNHPNAKNLRLKRADIRIMSISREGGRRKISVWFSCSACC